MKLPPIPPDSRFVFFLDGCQTPHFGNQYGPLIACTPIRPVMPVAFWREIISATFAAEWRKAGDEERAREWEVWGGWAKT